ncbi:hypothetical protein [Palaeococcus ferrophilus]|uniref:hypothetical protein n=1 Tax=Palaeococcus ferrophilus TaxID=83868 RepID=UPI00147722C9|nr:hypothetical protein [Palaeococcus ferrophilus]
MGEVKIKVPPDVDLELFKNLIEMDAKLLAKAMRTKVYPGMLGKATVEELESYAEEAGR